jgi:hypothetical protein
VAGKRHHYAPGLLLRRFAEASGKREGLVWRLDKVSGQPRPVAPKYEAALPHYYRLEHPDGTTDSRPEDLLASIENATGPILQRLERGQKPTDAERAWLARSSCFSIGEPRSPVDGSTSSTSSPPLS